MIVVGGLGAVSPGVFRKGAHHGRDQRRAAAIDAGGEDQPPAFYLAGCAVCLKIKP